VLRRFFILTLALSTLALAPCRAQQTYQEEADRLATLLNWQSGSVVAEIGAGDGQMTLAAVTALSSASRAPEEPLQI
jgi:tRNA G46 methylase TrmB